MAADVQIHIGAMFDDFNKAIFDAKTKLTGLGDEMDKAFARMDKASKNVTKLGESLSMKLTLPLMALGGLAVKSFAESEQASMKLDSALRSAGDTSLASKEGINKLADELKELTAVDDDVVKGLVQVGLQMGLTIPQAKAAAKDAIGLSKAFGVDLDGAMRMCGQAYQGNIEKLARYIPALKTAGSEAEKQAIYQKAMASAFETAKAAAESPVGSYEKLALAVDDLGKGMGKIISEYIGPFIITLSKMVDEFNNADESTKTVIVTVAALAAGIGPLLIIIGKAISLYKTVSIVTLAFSAGLKGNAKDIGINTGALVANRAGIIAQTFATNVATAAQKAFNIALKSNPIGIIITLMAAAVGAFVAFGDSADEATQKQKEFNDARRGIVSVGAIDPEVEKQLGKEYSTILAIEDGKEKGAALDKMKSAAMNEINALLEKEKEIRKETDAIEAGRYNTQGKTLDEIRMKVIQNAEAEKSVVEQISRLKQRIAFADKNIESAQSAAVMQKRDSEKKLAEDKAKFREQMSEYMKKAGRDESELEEIRYMDECQKYKDALANRFISANEYWAAIDKLEDDHAKNSDKIERDIQKKREDSAEKWESTWKGAFSNNTDIAEKFRAINTAVADGTLSGWQGTAAKIAAAFTSAFSAVSNVMNSLFAAQTQAAEKKYSKLSADEEAYQAYQDQKTAKEFSRMSAKEKKESKLQEAANKAQIKRENELARAKTAIQRKSAIMSKVTGIAEATINTFLGAARAFKDFVFPYSAIVAGMVTALGMAQVAAIAATPLPSTSLAWGGATTGRTVAEIGEAGREVVMPLDSQYGKNAIGILVEKMWAGLEARAAYASGSRSSAAEVQQQIAAASAAQGGGSTELSLAIYLDAIKFGEAVTTIGDRGYYRVPARIVV